MHVAYLSAECWCIRTWLPNWQATWNTCFTAFYTAFSLCFKQKYTGKKPEFCSLTDERARSFLGIEISSFLVSEPWSPSSFSKFQVIGVSVNSFEKEILKEQTLRKQRKNNLIKQTASALLLSMDAGFWAGQSALECLCEANRRPFCSCIWYVSIQSLVKNNQFS